ncbi:putative peroxidase [Helianthus annuus]|nr:putative peroxidase [Helianthus annuus]
MILPVEFYIYYLGTKLEGKKTHALFLLFESISPNALALFLVLILFALAARDSIVVIGGPSWKVPTGRRDGVISVASESLAEIPAPFDNITTLIQNFANKSLDIKDLVLLSGSHTIGISLYTSFSNRPYNLTGVGDQDPTLDSEYAANLKSRKCRTQNDNTTIVEMDPGSRTTFDLSYYSLLLKRRGLFESDSALTRDSNTLALINQLLQGSLQNFLSEFAMPMEKMGRIEVKTGTSGEIRKNCAVANSTQPFEFCSLSLSWLSITT